MTTSRSPGTMPPMSHFHPACCTALREHWPLPFALPGTRLVSTAFQSEGLQPDDFIRCAIPPVSGAAKRQCEYLAGRLCAREALHSLTGQPDIPIIGVDRAPCWPDGVAGSITHSHGQAAALVGYTAHWRSLGVDLERVLRPERSQRLLGEILTPGERERLNRLDPTLHPWLVSLTFSAKESLFKALYPLTGVRFYFQDAELLSWTREGQLRMGLLRDLNDEWQAGATVDGQFGTLGDQVLTMVAVPIPAKS